MALGSLRRAPDERVNWVTSIPFFLIHLACLAAFFTGVTVTSIVLCLALFWGRMFFITAGYHRYFAHKSYKLGRVSQFVMAFGAQTSAQKGALWWAAHHRDHHRFSDTDKDIHSPRKGFWWSHVGWILCDRYGPTKYDGIKDFARYPELVWLNKHDWIAPWSLAVVCYLIGGWSGLVVGLLLVDGAALARDLHGQLGGPRVRPPPLRDHRHQPQLAARGAAHRWRGLAQQPPPLPELRPPGLLLVGDRRHLLRAQGAQLGRHREGPPSPARAGPASRSPNPSPNASSKPPDLHPSADPADGRARSERTRIDARSPTSERRSEVEAGPALAGGAVPRVVRRSRGGGRSGATTGSRCSRS